MTRRPAIPALALACAALLGPALAGCSMLQRLGLLPLNPLQQLQAAASVDANLDSATAVDVVWVFDSTTLAALPKTGPLWFANKAALLAGLADRVAVVSLEIPPGTAQPDVALPERHRKAIAVLAYVNFLGAAGQPVATLTPFKCARIALARDSVAYSACGG